MKVLRVEAPGTDPALAQAIAAAVASFNANLDIRLRFLSIGIEETVVRPADAASAAERVGAELARGGVDAVLLLGDGEAAVAAAAAAVRAQAPLVRPGAGRRSGPAADAARAVDRLANVLIAHDAAALEALREEGLAAAETLGRVPAAGERVVRALTAARRRDPC
jgi:hypothetical protein